jgi:hypothetical protein
VFGNLDCTIFGLRELCLVILNYYVWSSQSCFVLFTLLYLDLRGNRV